MASKPLNDGDGRGLVPDSGGLSHEQGAIKRIAQFEGRLGRTAQMTDRAELLRHTAIGRQMLDGDERDANDSAVARGGRRKVEEYNWRGGRGIQYGRGSALFYSG